MTTSQNPVHPDEYAYWFGEGYAPNFSREVAEAAALVARAENNLLTALRDAYPRGAIVTVVHHRGSFVGEVAGWDRWGTRVVVRNLQSLKISKWWAAHVELGDHHG